VSKNTLENPLEIYDLANTATKALTVDTGLGSISKLTSFAATLRSLRPKNVNFITMPTVEDPANTNRLLLLEPEDDILWNMLDTGQLWQGGLPVAPASDVDLTVLNGTGQAGLAAQTAASLEQFGFHVTSVGNAPFTTTTNLSYTGPSQAEGAYALMGALQQAPDNVQDGVSGPITLTLGTDFAGVNNPPAPAPTPSATATPAAKGSKTAKAKSPAPATTPTVSTTPDAGQAPDGTPLVIPGQSESIESRNAGTNICGGELPDANPNP
jgi:hypothetical protein